MVGKSESLWIRFFPNLDYPGGLAALRERDVCRRGLLAFSAGRGELTSLVISSRLPGINLFREDLHHEKSVPGDVEDHMTSQKSARDCDWFIIIMPAHNRIARSESIVPIISKYNHL